MGSGLGRLFDSGVEISLHTVVTPRLALPLAGLALLSVLPILYQRWRVGRAS
jgi:lipopolysaccharide/colanic/teichoic acid biosynthesis glycosyltransferase